MTALDRYVTLGRSGLRVSPLTLGTMTFGEDWGWGSDAATSHALLDAYVDAGGNSLDTANAYTNGHSEAIIGDWLAADPGRRDQVVLGTKFFCNLREGDPNGGGAGRGAIRSQLEASLRRLRTDHVDLYWLHQWDRTTPLEETLRTLDDLVRAGTVRYVGFSDLPTWVAAQAQTIAMLEDWTPAIGFQLEYSLLERTVEQEYLPMCRSLGMGVLPWSPLAGGLLSGKYRRDGASGVGGGTATTGSRGEQLSELDERQWGVVDELVAVADELEASPASVALAWVAGRDGVSSVIFGTRRPEQLDGNLAALDLPLTADHRARLDAASRPDGVFPAAYTPLLGDLQYAGATVDGVEHGVPAPLQASPDRY